MARRYRVAVVGNPNVGKSTLFTALTREIAHIANWPGTTVERKEAVLRLGEIEIVFVDLPGIYTLAGTSVEEQVAREYILRGDWDAILVLVDSLAPERTLYLAVHILEVTGQAVIALTKWDAAHGRGVHIHVDRLERHLGVPVIPVSAVTGYGVRELIRAVVRVLRHRRGKPLRVDYGQLEPALAELEQKVEGLSLGVRAPARWIALKLLEGDAYIRRLVASRGAGELLREVDELRTAIVRTTGKDPEELAVMYRFNFVDSLSREAVVRTRVKAEIGHLERLLLSPFAGPIISLTLLLGLYMAAFTLNTGFPLNVILSTAGMEEAAELIEAHTLSGFLSSLFDTLAQLVATSSLPPMLRDILANGVIPGVGAVLSFYPLIFTTVFILSLLEDSGVGPYMAVSLHRVLQVIGLSGRAIYPLLIGLGCNVPAVMASRTSPEESERRQLIFSVPFVPCQAALVVAIALTSAYFSSPLTRGAALALAYAVAFALLSASSLVLRRIYGAGRPPELLFELPPLHRPSLKVLWWISWDYSKHFLKKAGVIIFSLSLMIWALTSYGLKGPVVDVRESLAYMLGRALSPALAPLGLWGERAAVLAFALLTGLVAKEAVLSSIAMVVGSADPIRALRALGLSGSQALALAVIYTIYLPCIATVAEVYKESGSAKSTLIASAWMLMSAFLAGYAVYWISAALGL